MSRRIITAREQVEMLSPWRLEAFIKEARYPQEWSGKAPYGYLPSGRARNRPPSVLWDPEDPDSGIIDPSEIRYERRGDSVAAFHPNGDILGSYSWDEDGYGNGYPHIDIAQVHPKYQRQGVGGGIIDHIREHHEPNLVHSGHHGVGSLSYQGRAAALRDLGNTEEEHNDYFNTRPFNYGAAEPENFYVRGQRFVKTVEQQRAHEDLVKQFEEDLNHPNYTGQRSSATRNSNMFDEYGSRHEFGYDRDGNYVGLKDGVKDSDGYDEYGYDREGYNRDGLNSAGYDRDGYDEYGFSKKYGLDRDGKTRHGYTPGDGTPPNGTVPMSQMASHWEQNGLLPTSEDHQQMMDDASGRLGMTPTMYAVRNPGEVSRWSGSHHVGNGDTLYSSLDRARQVAYHPDDPGKDKNIVSVDYLDPDHLHTDASGKTPEDFHYAPVSGGHDAEDTASTPANIVHDPQRQQRILGDLGHGWNKSTQHPFSQHSGFDYTDPESGRSGRMYLSRDGTWHAQHEPQFGRPKTDRYDSHRDAANAIREGTRPGPTMDQHALEVNNNYEASSYGAVDWQPHPSGQGLMAHTPHGDLHLNQDPETGRWNWSAGPHGSQPGDAGNMRSSLPDRLNGAAASAIRTLTRNPFHGGLSEELDESWQRHPTIQSAYTRRLPSGRHALIKKNDDGTYSSGIQLDNGSGQPYDHPSVLRESPDLDQAKLFIHHHENRVPGNKLGEGWKDWRSLSARRSAFPSYIHKTHPSGAEAFITYAPDRGGWVSMVSPPNGEGEIVFSPQDSVHKTPQAAAAWASGLMNTIWLRSPLGNQ